MCVTCGCGKYSEKHGDDRNITIEQLNQAAQAASISLDEVSKNVQDAISKSKGSSGA